MIFLFFIGILYFQVGMKVQNILNKNVMYYQGKDYEVKKDFLRILDDFKRRGINPPRPQLILVVLPFKGTTVAKLWTLIQNLPEAGGSPGVSATSMAWLSHPGLY